MAEKQTVKEPTSLEGTEGGKQDESQGQEIDVNALLETLNKIGVKNPRQLEGLHQTAQAYGTTAQRLGERNQELDELRREVEALRTQRQPKQSDEWNYETPSIDLEKTLERTVRNVIHDDFIKPQRQAAEAYYQQLQRVQSDDDFPLLADKWQEHFNNPTTQLRLHGGKTDVVTEYTQLVRSFYRDIAMQSRDALSKMGSGQQPTPSKTEVPHLESGDTSGVPRKRSSGELAERVEDATKNWKGTSKDMGRVVDAFFPKGDKFTDY